MRTILFSIALLFLITFLSATASAETCGVCKDAYLSCLSKGDSPKACEQSMKSCQSACFSDSSSQSSGKDYGWMGYVGGLLLGGALGFAIWMLAGELTSTVSSQYSFLRSGLIFLGMCFIGIAAVLMLDPKQKLDGILIWNLLSFWALPAFFLRYMSNEVKLEHERSVALAAENRRIRELQQIAAAAVSESVKPRRKRSTSTAKMPGASKSPDAPQLTEGSNGSDVA